MVNWHKWYIPVKFSFCFSSYTNSRASAEVSQLTFTCSISVRETLEKDIKYVQS